MIIAVFILLILLHSLISCRLERTVITAPILFTAAGILMFLLPPESTALGVERKELLHLAEVGLAMTLFTDATHINLQALRRNRNLPVRLLGIGMLPTILLGVFFAQVLFGGLSLWEAGILAAILAPTDAGLGQVIVSSSRVPIRIRESLNVEAGLNDGLAVPFLMLCIAMAPQSTGDVGAVLTKFLKEQIGYGIFVGVTVGLGGGWLLGIAQRKKWMAAARQKIGLVTVPLLCVIASEAVGASMFIAAFVAGLMVQIGFAPAGKHAAEFAEDWGQLLDFFVFYLFGWFVGQVWPNFTLSIVLYAVLSLTVVRMVPVALALVGTALSRPTVLFMGWFGPRGLASIVLGLVYLEEQVALPGEPTIRLAVMATVLLSIFAHGVSALPGIDLYSHKLSSLGPDAAEFQICEEKTIS